MSDYEVEDRLNDSISFDYFCGMNIDEVAPDHSTLSRFRTALTKLKLLRSYSASLMHNWKLTTSLLKREL
ncbi:transposase [Psychroflexus torquis]|uniref:transposase n=1 Tax=Psychroflexus torquis TaxID=57029 RepID=UPI0012F9691B|nr:transposase [Psychroflexus torquis]